MRFLKPKDGTGTASGRRFPSRAVGIGVVLAIVASALLVYQKERISTTLTPGETMTAQFTQEYKLRPYRHKVKLAGAIVGTITDEEYDTATQLSTVTMKVDDGVLEKLGSAPSAFLRPTLVLGGEYYVELRPGGSQGSYDSSVPIPRERTTTPVELDRVLSPLNTADAQAGLQSTVRQLDGTLAQGGRQALRDLTTNAPAALAPTGGVLDAARGTQPDRDLTDVVTGFESTAEALSREEGRVSRINEGLGRTAAALAVSSPALRSSTETSVETQRIARQGLLDLQPTLRKLTETAPAFRDSAQELDPLLQKLDDVLPRTRALTGDLRKLLPELRPLTGQLRPVTTKTTRALDDLEGPVLDRINGPIRETVFSKFRGSGPYAGAPCCHGDKDSALYQETGYLLSHLLSTFSVYDTNGAAARLSPGFGSNALGGGGFPSFEQILEALGASPRVGGKAGLPKLPAGVPAPGALGPGQLVPGNGGNR